MFILVVLICIWNLLNPGNFDLLWRWFACSNQVLAALSLWVSTFYLFKEGKYKFGYLFTFIPALIMSMVVITYICGEPRISLGRWIPMNVSYIIGGAITFALMVSFLVYTFIYKKKRKKNLEIE
jgi:carbon starvation protein CstA